VLLRQDNVKCQMSKRIYIAQFHAKHLNCARCTSISRRGSSKTPLLTAGSRSSTGGEFQTVGPRQRRPADRVCYVDTAERSNGADWLIVDVYRRRRRPECSSCFVFQTPTDHACQLVLRVFRNVEPVELVVNQR